MLQMNKSAFKVNIEMKDLLLCVHEISGWNLAEYVEFY